MPIVFAPQQPFDYAAAYGYGQVQQNEKNRDYALRAQALAQQQQESIARQQMAAAQFQQNAQMDAARLQASLFPSQRDYFNFAKEQESIAQRGMVQDWLSDREISHKEDLRYQQMNLAIDTVLADTGLSDDEKMDYLMQIKTKIDPYEQRKKKAMVKQEEMQTESMQKQMERQEKLFLEQEKFRAMTAQERLQTIKLPGGREASAFTDPSGKMHIFEPKETAAEKEAAKAPKPLDESKIWRDTITAVKAAYGGPEGLKGDALFQKIEQEFTKRRAAIMERSGLFPPDGQSAVPGLPPLSQKGQALEVPPPQPIEAGQPLEADQRKVMESFAAQENLAEQKLQDELRKNPGSRRVEELEKLRAMLAQRRELYRASGGVARMGPDQVRDWELLNMLIKDLWNK